MSWPRAALDRLARLGLRCAYGGMRVYWAVCHPRTHAAVVALWHGGEVLLVRTSYSRGHWLPGGHVRRGETGREAARRELSEELGLRLALEELEPILDLRHRFQGKEEHVEIFELAPAARPTIAIDRREIVEARFYTPAQALSLEVYPPARRAIEHRAERARAGERAGP